MKLPAENNKKSAEKKAKTPQRCVFDTTTYSELLRGHNTVAAILQAATEVLLPNVVIAELQYGFRLGSRQAENERLLSKFTASSKISIVLPDNSTTNHFVDIAVFGRKTGVKLSTRDLWIAAASIQSNATLVTFDNDFNHLAHPALKLLYIKAPIG